jgi:hypothetical protein
MRVAHRPPNPAPVAPARWAPVLRTPSVATTLTGRSKESTLLLRLDGQGTLYQQTYRALSTLARRIVHQDPSPILQRPGLLHDFRYGLPTVVGPPGRSYLVQRSHFWTSKDALNSWHMDNYHKHAKEWAARGAIMEDIITNFELASTRLLRVCPCCGEFQDMPYDLTHEQGTLAAPCPECGYIFPTMPETSSSTAVFKDLS